MAADTLDPVQLQNLCVIETEPNPASKIRYLSLFPTAIFEVASAQYITALTRLADLRIVFVCFGIGKHCIKKNATCLHMYVTFQKL